ncbi:hypothetical protein JCM3770_006986 [Rhodotorula araucariae]
MAVRADSSEDELVPPAVLYARAAATRTASISSPKPQDAFTSRPSAAAASASAPTVQSRESKPAPTTEQQEVDDADERERHRRLAEELFPPSPPSAALAPPPRTQHNTGASPPRCPPVDAVRVTSSLREASPDFISDSEAERVASVPATPRVRAPLPRQAEQLWERKEEEIIAACTDSEEDKDERRLPEDVTELDGVLVYDPTPKKRPVKFPPARPLVASSPTSLIGPPRPRSTPISPSITASPPAKTRAQTESPKEAAGAKKTAASGLRREIDLTGSSSEEDELPSPPKTRLFPSTPTTRKPARAPRLTAPPVLSVPTATPRARPRPAPTSSNTAVLTPAQRTSLPLALIRELDRSVFRCTWDGTRRVRDGGGKGLPDGVEVVWNKRLRNTAGRASWKSTRSSTPGLPGSPPVRTQTHRAVVELSTHVTDTPDKLKHTLAHELCHLAAWALSGEMKPPHGAAFKLWAKRVMLVRPDIEVTTTHSYEIAYRFRWQCVSATCGKIFGRHSNSVNPATHGCPCGARLVALDKHGVAKPAASAAAGSAETPRKKTKWQEFMQAESPRVRRENPGVPQSEVLKLVAERWRTAKLTAASSSSSAGAEGVPGLEDSIATLILS